MNESKMSTFFKGVKAEFNKIIWPTREDIIKQTTAVVVVSAITCALIAVLDIGFETGMNFLTSGFFK
ncbi:MAG: preprotein translocase subunit SecE [Butyrivibrio sp.]|nr:preprotein translocase subunit SecE [Butyrivibrio sp.]